MMQAKSPVPSWLLIPGLEQAPQRVVLPEDEAHHVVRVCRARVGDPLTATDGEGTVARLELESIGGTVEARVLELEHPRREREAWILCGAPEGARADWLVEKLAELGVARFRPIESATGTWRGARPERWRRLTAAAVRQSCQAWRMRIMDPAPLEQALDELPEAAILWLASETGRDIPRGGTAAAISALAVGPMSGFVAPEIGRLESRGFAPVRLAPSRLRTETAALAWTGLWAAGAL